MRSKFRGHGVSLDAAAFRLTPPIGGLLVTHSQAVSNRDSGTDWVNCFLLITTADSARHGSWNTVFQQQRTEYVRIDARKLCWRQESFSIKVRCCLSVFASTLWIEYSLFLRSFNGHSLRKDFALKTGRLFIVFKWKYRERVVNATFRNNTHVITNINLLILIYS